MAELLRIQREVDVFKKEYINRNNEAEESRRQENQAATRIQSWFRACKVRAYLSHLHKKAIIIQKIWRGFTARAHFRQMVKAAYFTMKMNYYAEMAVRIQQTWRGFFVRKHVFNFYARKRYLEGLTRKNELVRTFMKGELPGRRVRACLHACPAIALRFYARELDELEELQRRERECLQMVKEQTAKMYKAQRFHHLVSTKQCPGVFNSPFRQAPHEMEQLLRQVKFQAPTRLAPRGRVGLASTPDPAALGFPGALGSPWVKTTRTCRPSKPVLPPIASKKQQGPVREPGEVWEQRMHCPDLVLRLQTSQAHLEDAQNHLRQLCRGSLRKLHHLSGSSAYFPEPANTQSFG